MVSRTKNRRNKARKVVSRSTALVPMAPASQRTGPAPRKPRKRNQALVRNPRLTDAGLAFLKCAFAAPDFSVDPGKGIPDNFHGRTLAIKDCNTTSVVFTPNTDTYIVVAPVPGFAYFRAEVAVGAQPTTFVGVPYPTYATNFGAGSQNGLPAVNNYSKFRYASMACGLYPTSNMMQFSGSVQVWRVDLNLSEAVNPAVTAITPAPGVFANFVDKRINGLRGIRPLAPRDNYSGNFIDGAYTFAFDKSTDFEWCDFVRSLEFSESNVLGAATAMKLLAPGGGTDTTLTGLGNVNTLVYKISTPTGAVNTAILRTWNCIELQPYTDSALFQFSGVSPPFDPLALECYHNLKMRFPVAVSSREN
nr:mature capsid protein beta [Pariacoto virus]